MKIVDGKQQKPVTKKKLSKILGQTPKKPIIIKDT